MYTRTRPTNFSHNLEGIWQWKKEITLKRKIFFDLELLFCNTVDEQDLVKIFVILYTSFTFIIIQHNDLC